ncbi:MAG: signal peptidase I [[Eubacterium] saphenum]|nr:signal peptidase I [[Eubacterium] saphenum]
MSEFEEEIEKQAAGEKAEEKAADESVENSEAPAENTEKSKDSDGEKARPFSDVLSWVNNVIVAVVAMLFLNLFVFRSITVDGPSMNDTLLDKDKVLITNLFYEPSFRDIVVIQADKLVNGNTKMYGEAIIKRVIGVAGDTIRINFEKGEVYRNGELLEEDYIKELTKRRYNGWLESNVDYVVPENCVFVMGDNRNVSNDSRNLDDIGFVDKNLIMGRAFVRVLPISQFKWL